MRISRYSYFILALVVCVLALGCSSGGSGSGQGSPGAPGGNSGQQPGGAVGAPSNQGNGAQAIGAPIKLPAFTEIGAGNIDELRAKIEAAIRDACTPDNDLCVTTVVEPRAGSPSHPTCFVGTKPDTRTEGTEIPRTTVLTIYSGSDDSATPCPPQGTSPDSSVDQQQSGSTTSTETTQQSSESTTSTETTQLQTPSST
jgi:hypothetical protein